MILKTESQNCSDHSEIFGITRIEYGTNTFRISKGDILFSCSLNEHGYWVAKDGDFLFHWLEICFTARGNYHPLKMETRICCLIGKQRYDANEFQDEQIDVSYTTLENKNQFGLFLKIDEENCTPVFPYYMLLGKATQHLPESVGQGEQKVSYQYKTDKDGFVTEIAMIYPNNSKTVFYRFTYE